MKAQLSSAEVKVTLASGTLASPHGKLQADEVRQMCQKRPIYVKRDPYTSKEAFKTDLQKGPADNQHIGITAKQIADTPTVSKETRIHSKTRTKGTYNTNETC